MRKNEIQMQQVSKHLTSSLRYSLYSWTKAQWALHQLGILSSISRGGHSTAVKTIQIDPNCNHKPKWSGAVDVGLQTGVGGQQRVEIVSCPCKVFYRAMRGRILLL